MDYAKMVADLHKRVDRLQLSMNGLSREFVQLSEDLKRLEEKVNNIIINYSSDLTDGEEYVED